MTYFFHRHFGHHLLTKLVMLALAAALSGHFGSYFHSSSIVIPGSVLAGILLFAGLAFVISLMPDDSTNHLIIREDKFKH